MYSSIKTPTLLLDQSRCIRNIERMVARAQRAGVTLRPHFKTHQSRVIGHWFRQAGVQQIATSSLGMARYFADDGWQDITVAFPVNLREIELIRSLAAKCRLHLLTLDEDVISQLDRQLDSPAGLYLKIDVGTHRTGIDPKDLETIDRCIEAIVRSTHLTWRGFLAHAGHTYDARSPAAVREIYAETTAPLIALKERYAAALPGVQISYGDTPSCSVMDRFDGIDEIRPGNFVFYDLMQEQIGVCTHDDIVVAVACPVVALHPQRNEVIVYGGGIHFGKDALLDDQGQRSYGMAVWPHQSSWRIAGQEVRLKALSQEHGVVSMPGGIPQEVSPGSLLFFLPVHSCMTAQCLGRYTIIPDGTTADHFAAAL